MPDFELKYTNLEEVLATVDPVILEKPIRKFFTKSALIILRRTQKMTPVDTNLLRSTIHVKLDTRPLPLFGGIESNILYARDVEFGTKPHPVSVEELMPWAHRKGLGDKVYVIAKAISERGTKAHHMFERGFEWSKAQIDNLLYEAEREISDRWNK